MRWPPHTGSRPAPAKFVPYKGGQRKGRGRVNWVQPPAHRPDPKLHPIGLTQGSSICASNFAGEDPSSSVGETGLGNGKTLGQSSSLDHQKDPLNKVKRKNCKGS